MTTGRTGTGMISCPPFWSANLYWLFWFGVFTLLAIFSGLEMLYPLFVEKYCSPEGYAERWSF